MTSQTTLLIDGDILVFSALSAAEKEIEWDEDIWTLWTDLGVARDSFNLQLNNLLKDIPGAVPYLCLTDTHNFRKDLDPTYKMHRKKTRKPLCFHEFRDWVAENNTVITKPSLEADDILGILATKPGNNAIISSGDKDLKQIPGKHLVDGKVITITKEEGNYLHMLQTLTGDPTDGYKGCPGMGKVSAAKLLEKSDSGSDGWWPLIVKAYEHAGQTEDDALLQARLARILRWEDWNNDKQEVILWKTK